MLYTSYSHKLLCFHHVIGPHSVRLIGLHICYKQKTLLAICVVHFIYCSWSFVDQELFDSNLFYVLFLLLLLCLMTLPNYLRTGRKKTLTSGVPVTPADSFSANSCAVYCYWLYDKTWTLKGRNCKCMEIYKKRITIRVRSNMAGSENYPLPFVGKRTHPLHLSNTKSLPGTYHHIEAAWVTCKIALNLWSLSLNRHMASMKRTLLLLLIGALHTQDWRNLQNVHVEFLFLQTDCGL